MDIAALVRILFQFQELFFRPNDVMSRLSDVNHQFFHFLVVFSPPKDAFESDYGQDTLFSPSDETCKQQKSFWAELQNIFFFTN